MEIATHCTALTSLGFEHTATSPALPGDPAAEAQQHEAVSLLETAVGVLKGLAEPLRAAADAQHKLLVVIRGLPSHDEMEKLTSHDAVHVLLVAPRDERGRMVYGGR